MEELRQSIKEREQTKIENKLALLQQHIGYQLDDQIDDDFIDQIPMESFVWYSFCFYIRTVIENIYRRFYQENLSRFDIKEYKNYRDITYNDFVNESLLALLSLHIYIVDFNLNLSIVNDSINVLNDQIQLLQHFKQLQYTQPNKLSIQYTKDKNLKTDIFNHYKLKYKAFMNDQEVKSIYAFNDETVCTFPILEDSEQIEIIIQGKRIGGESKEFVQIAKVTLELDEILISFDLRTFSKQFISPVLLMVDYIDGSEDAPFKGQNQIELKFSLQMPTDQRLKMIEKLIEKQSNKKKELESVIHQRDQQIKQIVSLFGNLTYITGQDIVSKDQVNLKNHNSCDGCIIQ